MHTKNKFKKTVLVFLIKNELEQIYEVLFSSLLLFIILCIFNNVWASISLKEDFLPYSPAILTWYLFFTYLILLSPSNAVFLEIEGAFHAELLQFRTIWPKNYLSILLQKATIQTSLRFCMLFMIGFLICTLLTGQIPILTSLLFAFLACLISSIIMSFLYVQIGFLATFGADAKSLFWVVQRFCFLFGGVFMPISFYPNSFMFFANLTPFCWLIGQPAAMIMNGAQVIIWPILIGMLLISIFSSKWLYARFLRSL